MHGAVLTQIDIPVVLRNHVDIVEHEAVEVPEGLLDFKKSRVHHEPFVKTSIVKLLHDKNAIIYFLSLKHRMKIGKHR